MEGLPHLIDSFCALEIDILFVEYRGYGTSSGSPSIETLINDVGPIYDTLNVAQENIIVMGRSIGSIPAVAFAHRFPQIQGLILESSMAYPSRFVADRTGVPWSSFEETSLASQLEFFKVTLQSYSGQALFLHCADDEVFDYRREAMQAFAWSVGAETDAPTQFHEVNYGGCPSRPLGELYVCNNKKLVLFENGGHNFIFPMNWKEYSHALFDFVHASDSTSMPQHDLDVDGAWWLSELSQRRRTQRGCALL
jgi:pimeloyl-ACP methyl ester carboxylesterase